MYTHECTQIYTHAHAHMNKCWRKAACTRMSSRTHVCMHACLRAHLCMHALLYFVCTHVRGMGAASHTLSELAWLLTKDAWKGASALTPTCAAKTRAQFPRKGSGSPAPRPPSKRGWHTDSHIGTIYSSKVHCNAEHAPNAHMLCMPLFPNICTGLHALRSVSF